MRIKCQKLQQFRASISACFQKALICLALHIFYQNKAQKYQGVRIKINLSDKDLRTTMCCYPVPVQHSTSAWLCIDLTKYFFAMSITGCNP